MNAPAGYGFCPLCGALVKLDAKGKLPTHGAVGRGQQVCTATEPVVEGVISP